MSLRYSRVSSELRRELISRQDGKCGICGRFISEDEKTAVVDHDHESGLIRGALCVGCNKSLGWVDRGECKPSANQMRYLEEAVTRDFEGLESLKAIILSVRVPESLYVEIEERSYRQKRSMNNLIVTALQEHYGKEESR